MKHSNRNNRPAGAGHNPGGEHGHAGGQHPKAKPSAKSNKHFHATAKKQHAANVARNSNPPMRGGIRF